MFMECDGCHAQWECPEERSDESCPECNGTAVHRWVSDAAVNRMRALLGTQKTTSERLKMAFAACTVGGETYADAVLTQALKLGYIELMDGTVWAADPKKR